MSFSNFRNCGGNKSNVMGAYAGATPSVMGAYAGATPSVMGAYSPATTGGYGATPNVAGQYYSPQVAGAQAYPSQAAYPSQTAPAIVNPTKQYVNTNVSNTVIPVVHPSNTTIVNKHVNTFKHYFPHTQCVVNECYNQNLICGTPHQNPCCPPRPFGY